MRKSRRLLVIMTLMASFCAGEGQASAHPGPHQELPMEEKLQLLEETAVRHGIPPELFKAIAFAESSLMQFKNGEPLISYDGGIGMMQVTNTALAVDTDRLKTDTAYNIEMGARILKNKWDLQEHGLIPRINDGDPGVLEHWYFAVMAYNGVSSRNDPSKNDHTYQEKVYRIIEKNSQLRVAEFPAFPTAYRDNGSMYFPVKQLNWESAGVKPPAIVEEPENMQLARALGPRMYRYETMRTGLHMALAEAQPPYYRKSERISKPKPAVVAGFRQLAFITGPDPHRVKARKHIAEVAVK